MSTSTINIPSDVSGFIIGAAKELEVMYSCIAKTNAIRDFQYRSYGTASSNENLSTAHKCGVICASNIGVKN